MIFVNKDVCTIEGTGLDIMSEVAVVIRCFIKNVTANYGKENAKGIFETVLATAFDDSLPDPFEERESDDETED